MRRLGSAGPCAERGHLPKHARSAAKKPRLNAYRESPGTLEEKLWKRCKWEFPPADETQSCWWIMNMEEADQTQDGRMICRSLACLRMELCSTRLASSQKLRQEWDKRLENNAEAVDRLQENRELWLRAGGPDPEQLASPTAPHMEEVSKTLACLSAMEEKHGPTGGLDSFIEEIKARLAHARLCFDARAYIARALFPSVWTPRRPPSC